MKNSTQKCMVIKIGSNSITSGSNSLDKDLLSGLASQVSELFKNGWKVVIVSSGSVALGMPRMKNCNIDDILCKQRAAARGQPLLMAGWQEAFRPHNLDADQLLFNKKNFSSNIKVLNAIDDGIVICNGDDTGNEPGIEKIVIYEDNDDLAADIAIAINADIIVYLTDVGGVLDKAGKIISNIAPDEDLAKRNVHFNGKNDKGTGGLESKHKFASLAAKHGIQAVIAKGKEENVLIKVSRGEEAGTVYLTELRSNK